MLGIIVIIWVPLVAIVWAVTVPFDKGRYWPGWLFRKLCVVHNWFNPLWRFEVSGVKITDPRRPYVVLSNHESFVDMLLISHLPWEMKWLSKESIFKIPLVGWLMAMAGDVRLIRGNKQSIVSAMRGCSDRLDKRVSVMLFPEGTRTRDGSLGEFKDGAFRLAIDHQVPILPLVVERHPRGAAGRQLEDERHRRRGACARAHPHRGAHQGRRARAARPRARDSSPPSSRR